MANLNIAQIDPTVQAIYQAIEQNHYEWHRYYLGASFIGRECSRELWLRFRWVKKSQFDGRMLRLFNTGHLEEPRLIKNLRDAGVQVLDLDPDTGEQWHISYFGGHFAGHADGVALGIHAAPKTWHLLEFKTHNAKSFAELQAKGVAVAKPEHLAQMQIYMHGLGLTRAYYLARNKDTDELYGERIYFDENLAQHYLQRAHSIIFANEPPLPIGYDSSFFKCKWCDLAEYCYPGMTDLPEQMPDKNCRTCIHSTPLANGEWTCENGQSMSPRQQDCECPHHRYIPMLFPNLQYEDVDQQGNVFYRSKQNQCYCNTAQGVMPCSH